jgi:phosphoribosyl 1,2-cyclic phosphodiesterase
MSLFISSINSGSNGNCYYVGNSTEAVLVDVGISCREVEKRMKRLGLSMDKVQAVFISHEHSDHIRGVEVISRKYKLPVYITPATLKHGGLKISQELIRPFAPHESISVGNLTVKAFPKFHDASEPHSFVITNHDGITVGVFTDIGISCENVTSHFTRCHAVFLEANYDDQMLEMGGYPYYLKKRIRSDKGHLSNEQALQLFTQHRSEQLTHLLLSHLSKDNNSPDLVHALFSKHAGATKIVVASRYNESEIFTINGAIAEETAMAYHAPTVQMTLFDQS